MSGYDQTYAAWQADPQTFWAQAAEAIDWNKPPTRVFDPDMGEFGRWFSDAECNTCWNCVDRHVHNGRGQQTALIWDSPVTNSVARYSYSQLLDEVCALAAVMQDHGVTKGDRVIIYMPMVAEAVFAMLACARLGAVHSVVFGGFAAHELSARIDDAAPKLVISASCGLETRRIVQYKPLLDQAIASATHKPETCIILQRNAHPCDLIAGRDIDMGAAVARAKQDNRRPECTSVAATDPLYILYTSGTTGQPKGVVRDNGGHMVALHWSMQNHYGTRPGDVFWAASDVGWVVGHSYICYGPLLQGCATVVFEGKPVGCPDAGVFWRVIQDHKVSALFAAPTAFRAIRKEDPNGDLLGKYDLSHFRSLFLAGERSDPDTVKWAQSKLNRPVIDHWWQTETGWAISGNPVGLGAFPIRLGSPGKPMPGYDVQVLDDAGQPVAPGTLGNIALKLPLPPSCFPTLWNAAERYLSAYFTEFPGYYATSDAGMIDEDGYVFIMARTDDIINVAGHRLSTGAMEEVITSHPDIAECAVVGVADALKGQMPVGFYVVNSGVHRESGDLEGELVSLVRQEIGPVAAFKTAIEVERLPKTRSGKVLRGTVQKIADGQEWKMPAAIDDPQILEEIAQALRKRGYARQLA
ncbi:propionyl-CoA synthetase [Paracoccus sp. Z330]|uniref:Propionyl-CoA synthetase n=1 Tax=Paracoccus onchidii TaxID=3017813 RepID=A0ABT4ZBU3_9RHOB|nr:propionyl-CoA synthetase [Paracoccus onchidii]MDB6176408.1 propionyl-CoA synthetase [Paracoccus onchidii]